MGIDARTPIPTTAGWQLARFISPGDEVFDYTGLPVKVVSVQEYTPVVCHKIWTKDGLTLVVDRRTGIPVYDSKTFATLVKWKRKHPTREEYVLPIYAPQNLANETTGWCRMPTCYPIRPEAKPYPVHPYELGMWIGDKHRDRRTNMVSKLIEAYGKLPEYIPEEYLFGSFEQRLAILRGVCASRPKCHSRVSAKFRFNFNNLRMFRSVHNLTESLGIRTEITAYKHQYRMVFRTNLKLIDDQLPVRRPQYEEMRRITHVTEVDIRPCMYIKTEDGNNTFLVSEGYLTVCL
jgi:hypothetical protein